MDQKYDRSLAAGLFWIFPGFLAVLTGILIPFGTLLNRYSVSLADVFSEFYSEAYLSYILTFTLRQATLSACLSGVLALGLSWIFINYKFPGKAVFLGFGRLIFAMPAIVIAFSCILAFGNQGVLNQILSVFNVNVRFLYSESAIIFAHVYFNLIFGVSWLSDRSRQIPDQMIAHARMLKLNKWQMFVYCDWPYLRHGLGQFMLLTFLLSLGSFGIPLLLGGGPQHSTLELAVFQALRVDFSPVKALRISMAQLSLSVMAMVLYLMVCRDKDTDQLTLGRDQSLAREKKLSLLPGLALVLLSLLMILPLLSVLIEGFFPFFKGAKISSDFYLFMIRALWDSLYLGVSSALLAVVTGLFISLGIWHCSYRLKLLSQISKILIQLLMGFSPVVLSLGFYLSWQMSFPEVFEGSVPLLIIYALTSIPWCWWRIYPDLILVRKNFWAQKNLLNLRGVKGFFMVELPALVPSILRAFLTSLALALGNLSVISVFSPQGLQTLSGSIPELMAAYRFQDAALMASVLGLLALSLFYISESIALRERGLR